MTDAMNQKLRQPFCRISHRSLQQAVEMLSKMLRQPVVCGALEVIAEPETEQDEYPASAGIGVFIRLEGDELNGAMLLCLPAACARWLSEELLRMPAGDLLSEPACSTLKEVGNIISSAYLASLDEQLGLRSLPAPPELSCGSSEELLQRLRAEIPRANLLLRLPLRFTGTGGELPGELYLLPQDAAVNLLNAR